MTHTPLEHELDGVQVNKYERGSVLEVSSSIGAWLITERYAKPEMRRTPRDGDDQDLSNVGDLRSVVRERRAHSHPNGPAVADDRRFPHCR